MVDIWDTQLTAFYRDVLGTFTDGITLEMRNMVIIDCNRFRSDILLPRPHVFDLSLGDKKAIVEAIP